MRTLPFNTKTEQKRAYFNTPSKNSYNLYNDMWSILFDVKDDDHVRVATFWGYDVYVDVRLTREEARKVWKHALSKGYKQPEGTKA